MSDSKNTANLLRPFFRGLPLIMVAMVFFVVVAKIYLHYATPMYESVGQIKLADAQIGVPHENLYKDFDIFATNSKIGAEVEMLKSQVVIKRALRNLDLGITVWRKGKLHKIELYKDCPFKIIAEPLDKRVYDSVYKFEVTQDSLVELFPPDGTSYKGKINHVIATPYLDIFIRRNDSLLKADPDTQLSDKYELMINSENSLVDKMKDILDVMAADKEVPVLRIAYKCPVAQKSADIVNSISDAYIKDFIDEKFAAADTTVTFLDREVKNYSERLIESEHSMEDFRKNNSVVNIKQETETDLRKLAELKNQLAGLQMELIAIDSLDAYIKGGKDRFSELAPNFQTFNDLLSTEIMKKIKGLQSDRRDLLLKYTEQNDKVQVIDTKLKDLYTYLQESINNTRKDIQLKYNDLQSTIVESEKEFTSFPYKDRNMTILERNFNLNDQIYRFLREKRTDAEIARSANISFHRVISAGEVPDIPVSPNHPLVLVLGGFFGLLGGTALVYLVHFLKDRVNNETNIQKNCDTPVFAKIPYVKKPDLGTVWFDKIAIDLQVQKNLEKGSVLAFTSFNKMEGKKWITLGVAKAIAQLGKKTALLDSDNSYKDGTDANVTVFDLAARCPDWRQPDKLKSFITKIKRNHDVIIIKNLSLALDSSALLNMSAASANLFILDSRITKMAMARDVDLMKEELGLDNIQFILNRDEYSPKVIPQIIRKLKRMRILKRKKA